MSPRVTVFIPVFNEARFVGAAIESILLQSFTDFELIVVDDASTDTSHEIIATFHDRRIRVVTNTSNIGAAASANRALGLAQGEYVARLDANDIASRDRLALQVAFLDAHPDVAVVGGQATLIDVTGRRLVRAELWHREWVHPTASPFLDWYRIFDTPLFHSSVMFRRSVVCDELGGYDERFPLEHDAELWARVSRNHGLANLSERVIDCRFDPRSMSADPQRSERAGYRERKIPFVHRVMRDVLSWEAAPRAWAETWIDVNTPGRPVSSAALRELVRGVDECAKRFDEIFGLTVHARKMARHLASLFARIMDKAMTTDRWLALVLLVRTLRLDPIGTLARAPRFVAMLVSGDAILRLHRRMQLRRGVI